MHFRHISAKIQPKNLKQYFDWEGGRAPWLRPWSGGGVISRRRPSELRGKIFRRSAAILQYLFHKIRILGIFWFIKFLLKNAFLNG